MSVNDEVMLMLISQQNQINKLDDEIKQLRREILKYNKVAKEEVMLSNDNFDKDDIVRFIKLETQKYNIDTYKATRDEGGGVVFKNKKTDKKKVSMLRRSRNYVYDNPQKFSDYIFRSWHTMDADMIEKYDLFIFSIEGTHNEPVNFFIFSKEEMKDILKQKTADTNERYHFYFIKDKNGEILEDRDQKIKVGSYFNKWDKL